MHKTIRPHLGKRLLCGEEYSLSEHFAARIVRLKQGEIVYDFSERTDEPVDDPEPDDDE